MAFELERLRLADNRYIDLLQTMMKRQGLTIAEYRLVSLIADGVNTQDKLAEQTKLDTSTLSRQLKNAVTKEKIDKIATGADKRQLIYSLTETGQKAADGIATELKKIEDDFFASWSDEDRQAFSKLIDLYEKTINQL